MDTTGVGSRHAQPDVQCDERDEHRGRDHRHQDVATLSDWTNSHGH